MPSSRKNPTLKQKIEIYEKFLHNINLMLLCGKQTELQKLIANADSWSYAHRQGNGELSEREQQKLINAHFWKLNNYESAS